MNEPMFLNESMENGIKDMVNKLPAEKQAVFWMKYESEKKNPTTAAILCFFLGGFGAHRFYLGQTQLGIGYVVACFALFALPVYTSWVEAFFVPGYVRKMNEEKAMIILAILGS